MIAKEYYPVFDEGTILDHKIYNTRDGKRETCGCHGFRRHVKWILSRQSFVNQVDQLSQPYFLESIR
jgi:hypothetical protein